MLEQGPTEKYAAMSQRYIEQADEEFEKGDLGQASNKAWGAAAQAVKGAGEAREWEHDTHTRLFDVVRRLAEETGDARIRPQFRVANRLHRHFYEGNLRRDEVVRGLAIVARFVALIGGLTVRE